MKSLVYAMTKAFETIAVYVIALNIPYHAPISSTLSAKGLLACVTILYASKRISAILFNKAHKGAKGNAATNNVTKPYWRTAKAKHEWFFKKPNRRAHSFLNIHRIKLNVLDLEDDNLLPISCVFSLGLSCSIYAIFVATNYKICCKQNCFTRVIFFLFWLTDWRVRGNY